MRMRARWLIASGGALALLLSVGYAGVFCAVDELGDPPAREEATELVSPLGSVLAYEVWNGEPHVVFARSSKVHFDHLRLDWISIAFPPTPLWQLTGAWYIIDATDAPANLGVARCTGVYGELCSKTTEVFGQINELEITALELRFAGEWHSYPVSSPGYAIRLEGFRGTPTDYRWLDAAGRVIWSMGQSRSCSEMHTSKRSTTQSTGTWEAKEKASRTNFGNSGSTCPSPAPLLDLSSIKRSERQSRKVRWFVR